MESLVEIRKILVPVDYSDCSFLACRYAFRIASLANAEVKLLHAFYSPAYDLIELTGNKSTQAKLREDVTSKLIVTERETMQQFREKLSSLPEVKKFGKDKLHIEINPGTAREEIARIAEEYSPDLIVMGTRGADKKESSVVGSVTEFVIKKLKYPVFAVPENYQFVGNEALRGVAYLTDFDETDFVSIKKLMGFTRLLGLTIYCVHIGGKTDNWERLKMDGLREYFVKTYNEQKVECEILTPSENILQSIDEYVREKKINILSLTTRRRNIIEKLIKPSLTRRLFYHTSIPMLVFH